MINDFNNINEIIVWTFVSFDRKNNQYRVNIRSRGPVINDIAASFGGGGHKFASGVRTNDKEVVNKLLEALASCCREYKEGANKNGSN
jgi:phosphoesterase RecJ-like protein